jgi:hypothetical protein
LAFSASRRPSGSRSGSGWEYWPRYAIVERLGRTGTLASIALNVFLGLVIVCLEALLAH